MSLNNSGHSILYVRWKTLMRYYILVISLKYNLLFYLDSYNDYLSSNGSLKGRKGLLPGCYCMKLTDKLINQGDFYYFPVIMLLETSVSYK